MAAEAFAHAIDIMDQEGWHISNKFAVPGNMSVLLLPPKSLELNPADNLWCFMRENWLTNRIFKSYDALSLTPAMLEESSKASPTA